MRDWHAFREHPCLSLKREAEAEAAHRAECFGTSSASSSPVVKEGEEGVGTKSESSTAPLRTCDIFLCPTPSRAPRTTPRPRPSPTTATAERTSLSKDGETALVTQRNCATLLAVTTQCSNRPSRRRPVHDMFQWFCAHVQSDADIRKNLYVNFRPSSDTGMLQGTVERVTKEPTASAPSTMEICVFAPSI